MRHLSAERLAALADEHPVPEEAAHLAACTACGAARDAHRQLVAGAACERDRRDAPLSDWGTISARLRAEGIIRTPATSTPVAVEAPVLPFARPIEAPALTHASVRARRRVVPAWALRAAAAVVLVAGGVVAGRATVPQVASDAPTAGASPVATSAPLDTGSAAGLVQQVDNTPAFRSTAEAQLAMAAAERTYQAAMQYLAMSDTTMTRAGGDPTVVYRARLAALDEAVAATRNALSAAPYDPVINRHYLASVSAREATLRQIDHALPVSEQLTRF